MAHLICRGSLAKEVPEVSQAQHQRFGLIPADLPPESAGRKAAVDAHRRRR